MSLLTILDTLLIGPLKLLFEIIFVVANRFLSNPGLSIIALSLMMNILVLPLYRRADAMQEESRDVETRLAPGASHIKKAFSGDERMMILQTYYRQNNYKPTHALKGSISLLLEVPFFMAAYQFLSSVGDLSGASLGPITDLGSPDGLIVMGGIAVNALPILMTLINVISSAIYLKGFPIKTKIQLYGMALFFLVFLYTSPSGLVFYWTLNNLFSLVKTIFYKLKNPQKTGAILLSIMGLGLLFYGIFVYSLSSPKLKLLIILLGLIFQFPMMYQFSPKFARASLQQHASQPNRKFFLLCCGFLTILIGVLIPSALIAASPQEFIDRSLFYHPLLYILYSLCLSAGTFLVWVQVFYWLANPTWKGLFEKAAWILCGITLINYMFFGTNLGIISANLQYENGLDFTRQEQFLNLIILFFCSIAMYLIVCKWKKRVIPVILTATIAIGGMGSINMMSIQKSVSAYQQTNNVTDSNTVLFQLSKTGKNVVVIMLDRALGQFVPYIFNERPQLKEQFSGFTFYDNTLSHGGFTNFGAPGLYGGYEYTPVEMNRRSSETLVEKHNESLKVMPVLFQENGYQVTVCDPTYANYQWIPDLSIFDSYPEINVHNIEGLFTDVKINEFLIRSRNFFCFNIMKTMPLSLQPTIYQRGNYNHAWSNGTSSTTQIQHSSSSAQGIHSAFVNSFSVLQNLSALTSFSDSDINTFLLLSSNATHEPTLLQTPDYTVSNSVNNSEYDTVHADRFTINSNSITIADTEHMMHYHINMASLIQLGNWFDYLRENDLYDNTRIILVSDHGRGLNMPNELISESSDFIVDTAYYQALLMIKDFESTEFSVSSEFMTNADVPTLAFDGLIKNPINPFTGNPITSNQKTAHDQYVILSDEWDVNVNCNNTFLPSYWASVSGNIHDLSNWAILEKEVILDKHSFS